MDLFSTDVLTRVVAYLPTPITFLQDSFFPQEQLEITEEIHFDVETGKKRIAPFVSPLVEGKIVEELGHAAKTFKPAYVKPKSIFDPSRPLKRALGERIGGMLAPMVRIEMSVRRMLKDHIDMITRRQEVMASEVLRTGRVTVKGEKYPTVVVDFGRDPELTVVLSGGARWNQAGTSPLDDLENWVELILDKSGASSTTVVMSTDVWKIFRKDAEVKEAIDRFHRDATLEPTGITREGGSYKGQVNNLDIFAFGGSYVDDDGVAQKILPPGTVIIGGPQIEGVRAYGAIRDEQAGYMPMPYFPKSWVENDPPLRFLMTQSAPLLVPYRPDASFGATVL
jgi:hypothetical protein